MNSTITLVPLSEENTPKPRYNTSGPALLFIVGMSITLAIRRRLAEGESLGKI